ncbi:hypothetical protein VE01_02745 [Pseudogymnoascus verrucosus]|uniref:Zn(2)-C6 fungal-type domain-containing protein n=1 Tax=Pseudogymnoascus verrucosus TaxID=342668 RepID=A0A1B8GTR8_9PEZI|nr:uncharacterized protein VE01_02745 [Pseudogymnoascus verrucosus]OBT99227.2 hypothetical protein VE01_02745 [Pseudogymnoascus verrucosus]
MASPFTGSPVDVDPSHQHISPPETGNRIQKRPAPRGTAAYPRKRANKACQVCRARRTKCDNKRPSCTFCEKAGTECVWAPHDLSSFDPASLAILERFDHLESLILSNGSQSQPQALATTPTSELDQQHPLTDQPLGCVALDSINIRIEAILEWKPLQNIIRNLTFPHLESPTESIYHGAVSGLEDLDIVTCNRLLDSFWKRVHSKNPILVQEDVKRYMSQAVLNGIAWNAKSCLVLLICALGTLSTDFKSQDTNHDGHSAQDDPAKGKAQAQHYFSAAQKRISVCLGKRGILEAQCLFYCGVYLTTTMQPEAAWSMFLQAKTSCQSFNWSTQVLPREEDFGSALKRNDTWVAEECTYWTCWKSEIEMHLELSPPGFRILDLWYPDKFPDPPRHTITDSDRSWFFYLAEIALRRLANRILAFIALDHNMDNPQDIARAHENAAEFEQEANDWVQSLPSPHGLDRSSDDVLNFILEGHLGNCYEFIYWPFIKHTINSPFRNLSTDEYVRKGLQVAMDRLNLNRPGFKHRHHGTYYLIRSCTRSAFVLLAAHFKGNLEDLMPIGWFETIWSVVDLLEFWQDELPDARRWRDSMTHLMQQA